MFYRFLFFLILLAIHTICLAEVTTYYEPKLDKVIVNSLLPGNKTPDGFCLDAIIFYKIKGTSNCFLNTIYNTLNTNVMSMPIRKFRLMINDTPFNLTFIGEDSVENLKRGEGAMSSRLKFAIPEELQKEILKAKSIKLIQPFDELILFESSAIMLKEWKEVIMPK